MRRNVVITLVCIFLFSLATPLNEANASGKLGNTHCNCHGGAGSVTLTLTGHPFEYTPGATYSLTLEITGSQPTTTGGFSFIVNRGTLSNAGPGVDIAGSQASHSNSNSRSWTFDWVAPGQGSGLVEFNAYGLIGDGDSTKIGDSWDSQTWNSLETPPTSNEQPTASNVIISPSNARSTDDLTLAYDYDDPESDPESGTIIEWYKNGSQEVSITGTTVSKTLTAKGEVWFARVIPNDGTTSGESSDSNSITLLNGAPSITSASITPSIPTADQVLSLSYVGDEPDGDTTSITDVRWFVDGSKIDSLDGEEQVPTLATRTGDVWNAQIMISDGELSSDWFTTDSITINGTNTAPVVESVTISPNSPSTTDDLDADWTTSDVESDSITNWQTRWKIDGVISQNHDGKEVISFAQTSKGQSWSAGVKVFDGTDWSEELWSDSVTIVNTPPVIETLSIQPNMAKVVDSLNYNYSFTDADDDVITDTEETWYIAGSIVADIENLPDNFNLSDVIRLELRINDGDIWSESFSAEINLENTAPSANITSMVEEPNSLNDLNISIETSDADGHSVTTTIIWQKNGFPVAGLDGSLSVPSSLLAPGSIWSVTVTPDDGIDQGTPVSMSFAVENLAPVAIISAEGGSTYVGLTTSLSALNSTDSDGIIVDASWKIGSQTYSGLEINFIPTEISNQVSLTVYDDRGASSNATSVIDALSPPMPSSVLAVQEGSGIRLTWEGTATQFQILRDGQEIALTTEKTYFDEPTLGGEHSYQVNSVIDGDIINSGPIQSGNIDISAIDTDESSGLGSLIMAILMLIIGGLGIAASFVNRGE